MSVTKVCGIFCCFSDFRDKFFSFCSLVPFLTGSGLMFFADGNGLRFSVSARLILGYVFCIPFVVNCHQYNRMFTHSNQKPKHNLQLHPNKINKQKLFIIFDSGCCHNTGKITRQKVRVNICSSRNDVVFCKWHTHTSTHVAGDSE